MYKQLIDLWHQLKLLFSQARLKEVEAKEKVENKLKEKEKVSLFNCKLK